MLKQAGGNRAAEILIGAATQPNDEWPDYRKYEQQQISI